MGQLPAGVILAVAPRMVALIGLATRIATDSDRACPSRCTITRLRYSPTWPRSRSFQLPQLRPPSLVTRIMALRSSMLAAPGAAHGVDEDGGGHEPSSTAK